MTRSDPYQQAIDHAAELCRRWEGYSSRPYKCQAGRPTIGYGCTRYPSGDAVRMDDQPITPDKANNLLIAQLAHIAQEVARLCPLLTRHPIAWGSVISWAYNLGLDAFRRSTMRTRLLAENWPLARAECVRWDKIAGAKSIGLGRRRAAEAMGLYPTPQQPTQY